MKGFTKDNAFHPITDKKGVRKKEGKSIMPSGIKLPSLRRSRDSDSGEIPPNEIYDESILTKYDGRYFRVSEEAGSSLAVDEYEEVNDNLFKHKGTVIFTQGGEETNNLLEVTGGAKKTKWGYELSDEKEFLAGLKSAGALEN